MSDLWKLTPRSKYNQKHNKGVLDNKAKRNLQQMSNFSKNKTKKELLLEIFQNDKINIAYVAKQFEDFDYEFIFQVITTLSAEERNAIFESTFSYWGREYTTEQLVQQIGLDKIIGIFTWIKNNYPDDYQNLVLIKWPEMEQMI